MSKIYNSEALQNRSQNLGTLNGFKLVFVTLNPAVSPVEALLDVEFYNSNSLADILDDVNTDSVAPTTIFSVSGGSRIKGGSGAGQVQVRQVSAGSSSNILRLSIRPIGDYSTYTLAIDYDDLFDPVFSEIEFKFRPGCFNLNCSETTTHPPAADDPVIDYLAKDYDSFKHVLITAMMERVPGWTPTSEADLDQVLIDLFAADADELSDFQDRVMAEAFLGRLRKRVSLTRHARLMDYHLHQGNQASTLLAVKVTVPEFTVPADFGVWTGRAWEDSGAVIFKAPESHICLKILNEISMYTWGGVVTALDAGATEADLAVPSGSQADAETLRDALLSGDHPYLLIEQTLNPETGGAAGVDKTARQIVQLLTGPGAAETVFDPTGSGTWLVRVHWSDEDKLTRRFCFVTECDGEVISDVSLFHGNLVLITHGRPYETVFHPPGTPLSSTNGDEFVHQTEQHFEETRRWGVVCRLPEGPLAYRKTDAGGVEPTESTLTVTEVSTDEAWEEQADLIESESDDKHFIVETDEYGFSQIRFGNGVNGQAWETADSVKCLYQVGGGTGGNVGRDTLTGFEDSSSGISEVWNPLDVTDGVDAEDATEALRRIPEAYRAKQLRAVTLEDYAARALELSGVSNAHARYAWTGSWRTVRVSIDPAGTDVLTEELRKTVAGYLDAVRLIGEDIEIRGAQYVSLDIKLTLCAEPEFWPEDLLDDLDQEFSDGYTSDGRAGFFHPDEWTFGQPLYASQLIGRALSIQGVDRVLKVNIRRWDGITGPSTTSLTISPGKAGAPTLGKIDVQPYEIIRVSNDPSHMEKGRIQFEVTGGRQ